MRAFFCYISLVFILSAVFIINRNLVNEVVSEKYFWFYGSVCILCIVTLTFTFLKKQQFRFSLTDLFILFFIGSVFISAFAFNSSTANSTKLVIISLLLVLYFNLRLIFENKEQIIQLVYFFIILSGLVETIWGMMQLYDFLPSQHSLFKITGTFFNPGPYAGYLAIIFPLALYWFLKNHKQQSTITAISINAFKRSFKTLTIRTITDFMLILIKNGLVQLRVLQRYWYYLLR